MRISFRIDGAAWISLAALFLLLPMQWVGAALLAAVIHESFHLGMLSLMKIPVHQLHIGARGAVLRTGPMEPCQELFCALAGPAGSLLLMLMLHLFPRLALCGLVQGCFNLIPLGSLDGARVMRSTIALLCGKSPCKQGKEGVQ